MLDDYTFLIYLLTFCVGFYLSIKGVIIFLRIYETPYKKEKKLVLEFNSFKEVFIFMGTALGIITDVIIIIEVFF